MKNLVILFLFLSISSFATDISNPFADGNDYYKKGNYQAAITSYEGILASGQESSELYFNLGNSYFKLHQVAPAIYNFEKSLLLNPENAEAKTNLDYAKKLRIDDIKELPKVGFSKLIQDFTSSYSYNSWAWTAVALAFGFLLFFIGYFFSDKAVIKRTFFTGMFVLLIGIFATIFAAVFEKRHSEKDRPAIVFAEMTLLKNEPKISGKTIFTLHEGSKVYVLETKENWKKVELTDETIGWIESSAIKELK